MGEESARLPSLLSKLLRRDAEGEGVGRAPSGNCGGFPGGVLWCKLVVEAAKVLAVGEWL